MVVAGREIMKYFKGLSIYIVIFVIILFILTVYTSTGNQQQLSYSEMLFHIENSNVESITLKGDEATVELITPNESQKAMSISFIYRP